MTSKLYSILRWCDRYGAVILSILWLALAIFDFVYGVWFGPHENTKSHLISAGYEALLAMSWFIIDAFYRK
jgi:hypothetical protein